MWIIWHMCQVALDVLLHNIISYNWQKKGNLANIAIITSISLHNRNRMRCLLSRSKDPGIVQKRFYFLNTIGIVMSTAHPVKAGQTKLVAINCNRNQTLYL